MEELFDYHRILVVVIDTLAIWLLLVVVLNNWRKRAGKLYVGMTISMLVWVNFAYLARIVDSSSLAINLLRIGWLGALPFNLFIFFFSLSLLNKWSDYKKLSLLNSFLVVVCNLFIIFSNLIIENVRYRDGYLGINYGVGMLPFLGITVLLIISTLIVILKHARELKKQNRIALRVFGLGLAIFYTMNVIFNIALPVFFDITRFYFFGDYSTLILMSAISYAIVKYEFLNIKLALSAFLISTIGIFLVIDILLLSHSVGEQIMKFVAFFFYLVIAMLLVRSMLSETKQKEELERVNKELSKTTGVLYTELQNTKSLYNLTSNVSKSLDPDVVAQTAVNSLPQDSSMIGAVLGLYDEEEGEIFIKAVTQNSLSEGVKKVIGDFSRYKIKLEDTKFDKNISANAFRSNNVISSQDISDLISPPVPKQFIGPISKILKIESLVSYPVTVHGKTLGVITYLLKEKNFNELSESEKQLYATYTYQIAIALENASLLNNLEVAKNQIEDSLKKEKDMMDILGHELRTPLAIARNAIFMMDMEYKKPNPNMEIIKDLLEKSKENIKREVSTLQTVLSTTRLENNRAQINYVKVDMKDVVSDSIDALGHEAVKKKLKLIVEQPDEDVFIWAGREQSQEIMDNLLSNAIKYTEEGTIEIQLKIKDKFVLLEVSDTGEGIPENEIANLGKKFHRVNPYTNSSKESDMQVVRPGGTGIGLYVVKGFLKIMGGKLEIKSKLGEGSTFIAYLPKYIGQDKLNIIPLNSVKSS